MGFFGGVENFIVGAGERGKKVRIVLQRRFAPFSREEARK